MKTYTVKLKSLTPILMNKFSFGKNPDMISVSDTEALADTERTRAIAERACYRNENNELVVPEVNLYRALITAGKKVKKGKSNYSTIVASAVQVDGDLRLTDVNDQPITDFEVDIRRGKNPATRGSVPIIRAKVNQWSGKLTVRYDESTIKDTDILQIVEALGTSVGLLDFRPEKLGSFGKFTVAN